MFSIKHPVLFWLSLLGNPLISMLLMAYILFNTTSFATQMVLGVVVGAVSIVISLILINHDYIEEPPLDY